MPFFWQSPDGLRRLSRGNFSENLIVSLKIRWALRKGS